MSYGQCQDTQTSYMDGVKVKISEKYKPPRKINLLSSYSQRLALNKQIQDSIPDYNFELEKTALSCVRDMKIIRNKRASERNERLKKIREEMKASEEEIEEINEVEEVKKVEDDSKSVVANEGYLNYANTGANNMLMPILEPIRFNSVLESNYAKQSSAFNISDFEDDTSSPFDNLALKSINDMEELAKVLKPKDSYKQPENSAFNVGNVYQNYGQNVAYNSNYSTNQYNSYNVPNTMSYVGPTNYSHMNGYYYTSPDIVSNSFGNASTTYSYSKVTDKNHTCDSTLTSQSMKNCKSVPDIIKSLEEELKNTHFESPDENIVSKSVPTSSKPKFNESLYPKPKVKENYIDPLENLDYQQKQLCRSIGSMGFPLDRVARVRKLIGDDHKKIVDHLLAMSELLDLGFPESEVSVALLQHDNNRDKALDKLVS